MEGINEIFTFINGYLWGWPMIVLLLGTHIFLTFRLRIPQRKLLTAIKLSVKKDKNSEGDVSQFGALATALAATIGTGNIVGVALAITTGGPGAVLWCWVCGLFGIATKYGEGLLAVKYRVQTTDGKMLGGPMYALERGLNMKWMAVLFAIFTALAAFGIGCTVQANAISTLSFDTYGVAPWMTGLIITLLAAAVLLGGVKRIAQFCGALVPFMAAFYIIGCIILLIYNAEYVWPAIKLIVESAFNPSAAGGGFLGASVMIAARYGIARGLFSNESGMGSAPIIAAAARTKNPVRQALVSSTGTFWDTVVICAITGIVLVSSILAYPDIDYSSGEMLTKMAFSKIPFGPEILTVAIVTFALSTILGWSYYGEKAMEYLVGQKSRFFYRSVYVIAVFIGSIINLSIIWNIADTLNALMAIPNLISLLLLSGVMARETKKYLWENRLDEE